MGSKPDYVLTRDYVDNNRINLQHYLWHELFGYLIHPKIAKDQPELRIADIGTGTGIWLTDLASRLPKSSRLEGLDISFDAAPPKAWLPQNVELRHWDIKTDVPEDLIGVYDIVHIRNVTLVLRDDEVPQVLARLVQLTKPGGFLQWGETDMTSFRIDKMNPENKTDALGELLRVVKPQDSRFSPTWVPSLADQFDAAGLVGVEADARDCPPHLAMANHECNLMINELLTKQQGNQGVASRVKELMPEVAEETRKGSVWAFTRWTVVGEKPHV